MSKSEPKDKGKKTALVPKGAGKALGYGFLLIFLLIWVFVLGVLTGRGDIHRWLQRFGLYQTEVAARLGVVPANLEPATQPVLPPAEPEKTEMPLAKPTDAESKPPLAATVDGKAADKGAAPASAAALGEVSKKPEGHGRTDAKKGKTTAAAKTEQQAGIAARLNFQNSLDSQTRKPGKVTASKDKGVQTASMTPGAASRATAATDKKKAPVYQVKVASYRSAAEAQKALADLKKKGFQVSLQEGKDKTGQMFVIQTPRCQSKAEAEKIAKKLREAKMSGQVQELKP
ncbi:MAG: SPOR domain-containing protein [Desulfobacca sp.]|uniref:SPOR domain-containing protein n=1 Tax=Desulfobacca sp. TaxID=2067990 RepID=UPI00404A9096